MATDEFVKVLQENGSILHSDVGAVRAVLMACPTLFREPDLLTTKTIEVLVQLEHPVKPERFFSLVRQSV